MKKNYAIIFTLLALYSCSNDDNNKKLDTELRYFRFQSCPESSHGNWQDTSFIAATKNPQVIQQCLDQLTLSQEDRLLFPFGKIEHGSAGYNFNETHEFNWHFDEDNWEMVELGIEIYDGCAYSDVELTNYAGNLGSYGGWGNRIVEEVVISISQ